MHRRKSSPLKQTNCLERDKTKMDSASCEINSEAAHLGHFGVHRAEARDEWERKMLGYVGGRAAGVPSSSLVWVARCILLEHSSCFRIALLTAHLSCLSVGSLRVDSEPRVRVQAFFWEVQGI